MAINGNKLPTATELCNNVQDMYTLKKDSYMFRCVPKADSKKKLVEKTPLGIGAFTLQHDIFLEATLTYLLKLRRLI